MGRGGPTAADRAYAFIRRSIMSGERAAGSMLSENDLAGALQVSRTPVRAALVRLQDEGWVTIYPQRGALVRELTATEVRESAQVRHALEVAGIARLSSDDRARLTDRLAGVVDQQEAALRERDFAGFVALAAPFHRAFVEAAENALMLQTYDRLGDRQVLSIVRSAPQIEREPDQVIAEHRQLLADVRAGDWVAFADRLHAHQTHFHDEQSTRHASTRRP